MNARSTPRAVSLGVGVGVLVALVYAVLTEPIELTLGLFAVGFIGGWLIGNGVSYGAWHNRPHETYRPLQWTALAIAGFAWVGAIYLAFVLSQVFVPDASTTIASRVGLGDFFNYLAGLELVPIVHVIALALMAFMAWRGAR